MNLVAPVLRRQLAYSRSVPPPQESLWTLDVLGAPAFAVVVYGDPAPQGSKTARVQGGRAIMFEASAKRQKPWRKAVTAAAAAALPVGWTTLDGPLVVDMVFTTAKGATLPKWKAWDDSGDDLDKLARSTGDALSDATVAGIPKAHGGVPLWFDDRRVTAYRRLAKVYGGCGDPDALGPGQAGAVIRIWPVPQVLIDARKAEARRKVTA